MATNISENVIQIPPECRSAYESGLAQIIVTHLSLSIALLGIPANILALVVLNYRVGIRSPTHILLIALAIEDILIIIFYSVYYIAIHYYESYDLKWLGQLRYIDTPLFYLVNWIKMIEIYTVVLLSLERYMAIRWPLKAARLCSVGRTKRGLRVIIAASGVFKLPNLVLDYRILKWMPQCDDNKLETVFSNAPWYPTFKLVYVQILDQVVSFVIPLSLLIFLNFGLILRIRRFAKRHRHGHWTGGSLMRGETSANSNAAYSEASQVKLTTGVYGDKTTISRNFSFQNSFRLRRHLLPKASISPIAHDCMSQQNAYVGDESQVAVTEPTDAPSRPPGSTSNSRSILLTLVGVVTIFIICETPTTVCFLFEMWNLLSGIWASGNTTTNTSKPTVVTTEDLYYYAYPAALMLVLVGCASNFFIYILMGRRFRRNCRILLLRVLTRIFCWTSKPTEKTDSGFIRPLKHLHKSKVKRGGLVVPCGRPMGSDGGIWTSPPKSNPQSSDPQKPHLRFKSASEHSSANT